MKSGDALALLKNRIKLDHYLPPAGVASLEEACGEASPPEQEKAPNTDATNPSKAELALIAAKEQEEADEAEEEANRKKAEAAAAQEKANKEAEEAKEAKAAVEASK